MQEIVHSKPSLTIFADASLYVDQQVVGWGGWARGDKRDSVLEGGAAPYHKSSDIAELWALALFAERLVESGYFTDDDRSIILQSDSLSALNMINAKLPNSFVSSKKHGSAEIVRAKVIKPDAAAPLERLNAKLSKANVVYLRHVRGHQGGKHSRSWVNEQCDRRAKSEARAQFCEGQ